MVVYQRARGQISQLQCFIYFWLFSIGGHWGNSKNVINIAMQQPKDIEQKNKEVLKKVPAVHNEGNMDQHVIHQESKIQYSNYV